MAVFASRKLAPPVITAEGKTFFDAARQGRFLIPVCTACDRAHWYPRIICPFCASDKVEWREASGRGTTRSHVAFILFAAIGTLQSSGADRSGRGFSDR